MGSRATRSRFRVGSASRHLRRCFGPVHHVLPPSLPFEMSTIGDFDGTIGAADIQGTAHGSDGTTYTFDTDMRFMQGVYIDTAGHVQHGSFAFI